MNTYYSSVNYEFLINFLSDVMESLPHTDALVGPMVGGVVVIHVTKEFGVLEGLEEEE